MKPQIFVLGVAVGFALAALIAVIFGIVRGG